MPPGVCGVCNEPSDHLQSCKYIWGTGEIYRHERFIPFKGSCCHKCASAMYMCYDCKEMDIKITDIYPISAKDKAGYKYSQMGICHTCCKRRPERALHFDDSCSRCGNTPGMSGFCINCYFST